jgi:hypothetical protein
MFYTRCYVALIIMENLITHKFYLVKLTVNPEYLKSGYVIAQAVKKIKNDATTVMRLEVETTRERVDETKILSITPL